MCRLAVLAVAVAVLICAKPALCAGEAPDIAARLQRIGEAYFDVHGQYPSEYTCQLRIPEMVESLDARGRQAWGDGHIDVTKHTTGIRMEAAAIRKPAAAPLFNVLLRFWQLRIGTELKTLEAHLPSFVSAGALLAVTAPLRFDAFEELRGETVRFGVRARNPDDQIREIAITASRENSLQRIVVRSGDGGSFEVTLKNARHPKTDGKWVVTQLTATEKRPASAMTRFDAQLGYTFVGDHVVYSKVAFSRTDAHGRPIRQNAKDVNPVTYLLSDYRIINGAAAARPTPDIGRFGKF